MKKPIKISKRFSATLRSDYYARRISAYGVARELFRTGWSPYMLGDAEALAAIKAKPNPGEVLDPFLFRFPA